MRAEGKKIRARWNGDYPKVGEFLRSRIRPRCAYFIVHVVERKPGLLNLVVDRVSLGDVPQCAVVHAWRWDPRTKVGAAWSAR